MNNLSIIDKAFNEHREVSSLTSLLSKEISFMGEEVYNAISLGKKLLIFGNGGSAADSQHIAAEFSGRFIKERRGLPAIALTTDTSVLTAIGNDYGFDEIFRRQVEAIANKGDVLLGISTSGNSQNVIKALEYGKLIGCKTFGLSGNSGGEMNNCCDLNILVPSNVTARIQEMHILIGHIICEIVDEKIIV
ncbi:D-sedoheptulose 7-phosphate isomerase [Chryseobacterium indoltheticum]|uniref:D-sedoheptulose 7-phosphate isomerase n=1 Tax=Chryseobacterium indoltheticum TaxID=254 RepID=UPI0028EBEEFF|nr:D-sedoheptulose 7-phosphate isomerase [Chryseobacterium indoltheticum]